jgi:hypothetical protein
MRITLRIASSTAFAVACFAVTQHVVWGLAPDCSAQVYHYAQYLACHDANDNLAISAAVISAFFGFWFTWSGRLRRMFQVSPQPQSTPPSPPSLAEHDAERW